MVQVVLKQRRVRVARMLANELRFNQRVPFKTHEKATVKIMESLWGCFLFLTVFSYVVPSYHSLTISEALVVKTLNITCLSWF